MPLPLTITCFLVVISLDCKRLFFQLYFKLVFLIEANVISKTPIQSIFPSKRLYFSICFTLLWTVYCKSIFRRSATSYTYKKIEKKQTTAYIGNLCIFLSAQNYCPRKKMLNTLVYKQSLQFYTGKKYIHNSWNIFKRPE